MHYRAEKDPETQLKDSDLLVRRLHLISESAMPLENRMQKRLLPQSPISCEHKQPIQERLKVIEKMLLQLFCWQWHCAITACHSP